MIGVGWGGNLGGGNLNIMNQWGNQKKREGQILKFRWGKQKGWNTIFDSNLAGRKILEETMIR